MDVLSVELKLPPDDALTIPARHVTLDSDICAVEIKAYLCNTNNIG